MAYYMEKVELYSDEFDWSLEEEQIVENIYEAREDLLIEDPYESEYEENPHGDDLEPEPPDHHQSYTNKGQTKPWCNETEYEFSYDDEPECGVGIYHYKNPPRRDVKPYHHRVLAPREQDYTNHSRRPKQLIEVNHRFNRHGPILPSFSGTENYLQWKDDIEDYFWTYKTLEKEKLSFALNTLRGEALKWWRKEANERWHYKEPRIRTWGELKWLMNEEYVTPQLPPRSYSKKTPQPLAKHTPISTSMHKTKPAIQGKCSTSKVSLELKCYKCKMQGHTAKFCSTRKNLAQEQQNLSLDPYMNDAKVSISKDLTETLQAIERVIESLNKEKKEAKEPSKVKEVQEKPKKKMVATKLSDKSLLEPHEKEQCKPSNPYELHELTCYRCHKRGHFAVMCPTRQVENHTIPELKTDSPKMTNTLVKLDFKFSNSSIMHLPLSKDVETGLGTTKEAGNINDMLPIKEEPPDIHQQVLFQGEYMDNKTTEEMPQKNHEKTSKKDMDKTQV